MTASDLDGLRQLLVLDYEYLKRKLARRLGSVDRASDALQETWLLLERTNSLGPIKRPRPYLLRIAYNLGLARRKRERETVTLDDARSAVDLMEDPTDPSRVLEARSELAAFEQALAELTPRRRAILLASRVHGMTLREIATRHGVSQRLVEMELKQALMHCGRRLGRAPVQRFGPKRSEGSDD